MSSMKDKLGVDVKVGDKVCYTNGGQGHTAIHFGNVVEITETTNWKDIVVYKCLIKSDKGRTQQTTRTSDEILSLEPYKEFSPELFL